MKHTRVTPYLTNALLRHVRDTRPSAEELLAWLGPGHENRYHVLRKARVLREEDGRIVLSPEYCSEDGNAFRFGNSIFLLDEDRVLVVRGQG